MKLYLLFLFLCVFFNMIGFFIGWNNDFGISMMYLILYIIIESYEV